jgi:hypothetical protein
VFVIRRASSWNSAVGACSPTALLDRGWGRAPQPHTGEDDKDVRITIRHITEGRTNGACGGISTAIPQLPSPPPVK